MDATGPGLGPHCVGTRVVVRRVLPGQTGPSGGPAMTDLLGVMESWTATETTVRAADGSLTTIALAEIVSGKPVPARASARMRISAEQATLLSNASWPAVVTEPLGEWLLRASGGFSARANSVMATGDPGCAFDVALDTVVDFYARHDLPPWAQVVVGSEAQRGFEEAGWVLARPGEADTLFQVGSVAQALRAIRPILSRLPTNPPRTVVSPYAEAAWLSNDSRVRSHGQAALDVLHGPDLVAFVSALGASNRDDPPQDEEPSTGSPSVQPSRRTVLESVLAKGRVAMSADVARDWAGITDVWVSPGFRRQGLGYLVVHELLTWAAERGATTAYLQTRGDNPPALALYERLGFVTHHAYRYLAARRPT